MTVRVQYRGQCDVCCSSNVPIALLQEYGTGPQDHRVWACALCLEDSLLELRATLAVAELRVITRRSVA